MCYSNLILTLRPYFFSHNVCVLYKDSTFEQFVVIYKTTHPHISIAH
jgi:hypothetical protein